VAAWIDIRIHNGRSDPYPSCHRHRCSCDPAYSGSKTFSIAICTIAGQGEVIQERENYLLDFHALHETGKLTIKYEVIK